SGMNVYSVRNNPDAGRVDEDFVRLRAIDDLRIASHKRNAGLRRRVAHRRDDALEIVHGNTLFQDKTSRKINRARPAHGQIIHRAMDGELANIASWKENRTDDKRIGTKRNARFSK